MPTSDLSQLQIEYAGASDVGMMRDNNEDAWWVGSMTESAAGNQDASAGELPLGAGAWLGVCGGLGGANAGEVASRLAVTETHAAIQELERGTVSFAQAHESLVKANRAINDQAAANPGWMGMGSTISFIWAEAGGALLGQVGDSRIYHLRDKRLKELTPDHSPVGRLRQSGQITEIDAREHPNRHLIDQCLGGGDPGLVPDCLPVDLQLGDILLFCSDGLTDGVCDAETGSMMGEVADRLRQPADTARLLIKSANRLSGRDNVTVIVGRVTAAS
jgi:protein phosphatase